MSEPIRILHVFGEMNRGGAETMIMNLYRNINRSKIQFDFMVHTNAKCVFDDEINKLGGKIYRVPRYRGKNHIVYVRKWKQFLETHLEYKIIHGHIRSTAIIYLKLAKKYGLTTIAHSHNTSSGSGVSALVKNIFQYPIRYNADYLFACSIPAGKWLFGEKVLQNQKFKILNNAIESKKFSFNKEIRDEKRNQLNLNKKFVVGHIGRFHSQKNHDFLIEIFKEIHNSYENAVLLLVGDGRLRPSIEKKVEDLELSDFVIFMGIRADISEILQATDLFLFPSLYEGLPVTLVEAQASGLKCIISDKIAKEIEITDQVEFVSLNKSAEHWAKEVLKYVDGYARKNYFKEIIKAGYDIEKNSNWLQEFYLQL